eukprot:COSAG02_NODE_65168_length_258_cov_1.540881_1_plen_23_part_10
MQDTAKLAPAAQQSLRVVLVLID